MSKFGKPRSGSIVYFNSSWDDRHNNAYCAWRHFHLDGANDEHADFTEELALQLLTNTSDKVGTEMSRSFSLENTILDVDKSLAHDYVQLTEHPKYARS